MSIRAKLTLLLVVVAIAPVVAFGVLTITVEAEASRQASWDALGRVWREVAESVDTRLDQQAKRIHQLTQQGTDIDATMLDALLRESSLWQGLTHFGADGKPRASRGVPFHVPAERIVAWRPRSAGRPGWASTESAPGEGDTLPIILAYFPLSGEQGSVVGVVDLAQLCDDVAASARTAGVIAVGAHPVHSWSSVSRATPRDEHVHWGKLFPELLVATASRGDWRDESESVQTSGDPGYLARVAPLPSLVGETSIGFGVVAPDGGALAHFGAVAERLSYGLAVAVLLVLVALWSISGSLLRPLDRLQGGLAEVATGEGDLQRTLEIDGWDELSGLSRNYNRFVASLSALIVDVQGTSDEIRDEVALLMHHNSAISRRIDQEHGDLSELREGMKRFLAQEEELARRIDRAGELARDSVDRTRQGDVALGEVTSSFREVLDRVREFSRDTRTLGKSVIEIQQHSKALDHIAERSRLLALNASIEANRSGGEGGGVDVVAAEIQLLSEKTVEFTHRIRSVIGRLADESQSLIRRFEDQEEGLTQGWEGHSQATRQALSEVRSHAGLLAEEADSIARLHRLQAILSGKVRRHVRENRRLVNNMLYQVRRNSDGIARVNELFAELDEELGRFRVGAEHGDELEPPIPAAIPEPNPAPQRSLESTS